MPRNCSKTAGDWEGSPAVWREMLIGRALGKVDAHEIFDALASAEAFARSPLSKLGFTLPEMRCEGFFYESLLEDSTGDPATSPARSVVLLKQVVDTQVTWYYEFDMARYLLGATSPGKAPAKPAQANARGAARTVR